MKNSLIVLFFICAGIVTGSLVAMLTANVNALSWLSYGLKFGLTDPFVLDLNVLQISFGLAFNLNISVIIFVSIAVVIAYQVTGRRRRR
ncbi:MAG: DUF4321 domain-containing protein [Clostridia bacterium]|nr:DUF4321 domain-containing protein [Clostridia bacterium]